MTEQTKKKTQVKKKEALSVYIGEDKIDLAVQDLITNKQVELLASRTPQKYIRKRKGRGGKKFDYVEINYVIAKLNAIFGFNWDVEVLKWEIGKYQIWVQIRLTVRLKDGTEIRKDAFGGSDVKRTREGNEVIDIADDLKSAQSDAIKKAASMLGVAWDVYSGVTKSVNDESETFDPTKDDFDDKQYDEIDPKDAFRNIPLTLSTGKTKKFTKFEVYQKAKNLKDEIGETAYYNTLGSEGYEHINEVPDKALPKVYKALLETYYNLTESQEHPESAMESESQKTDEEGQNEIPF